MRGEQDVVVLMTTGRWRRVSSRCSIAYFAPKPSNRPSAATAGELVTDIGTPGEGADSVCRTRAPSRLLTAPSNCPSATGSPGRTAGSHQPSYWERNQRNAGD